MRLSKQRNVDLTTDGLWAMPLNSGWVPVKSRRLQDWQQLKKYGPNNKNGDVCPNGVPALPEKEDGGPQRPRPGLQGKRHFHDFQTPTTEIKTKLLGSCVPTWTLTSNLHIPKDGPHIDMLYFCGNTALYRKTHIVFRSVSHCVCVCVCVRGCASVQHTVIHRNTTKARLNGTTIRLPCGRDFWGPPMQTTIRSKAV